MLDRFGGTVDVLQPQIIGKIGGSEVFEFGDNGSNLSLESVGLVWFDRADLFRQNLGCTSISSYQFAILVAECGHKTRLAETGQSRTGQQTKGSD